MMATLIDVERLVGRLCFRTGAHSVVGPIRGPREYDVLCAEAKAHLSTEEFALFESTRSRKRAAEFCAGRMAANRLLAAAPFHLARGARVLLRDGLGAPVLKEPLGVHVSISHSDRFAVAAAATRRVGVDLEQNEARPACFEEFFLCEQERSLLAGLRGGARQSTLNQLWCRKEAACKVGGWGATIAFRDIDCSRSPITFGAHCIELHSDHQGDFVAAIACCVAERPAPELSGCSGSASEASACVLVGPAGSNRLEATGDVRFGLPPFGQLRRSKAYEVSDG
jgi:phosphopantetheinyl transferase